MKYQRSSNPVPPMEWKDYIKRANRGWKDILESAPIDEAPIQHFLEENPSLIPGAYGISFSSGHAPIYGAVFSQPELPGFHSKKPDFMWIATSSKGIYPILIEIESLNKKWFRQDGQPTAEFTQAQNQMNQWRIWFSNPVNQLQFREVYLKDFPFRDDIITPHYVLICGRRKDLEPYRNTRSVLMKKDEEHMSYDRLSFSRDQSDYLTVKMKDDGVYAIKIPPISMISPDIMEYWSHIKNLPQFFLEEPDSDLSQERKEFLFERFKYGLEWFNSKDVKSHNIIDRE